MSTMTAAGAVAVTPNDSQDIGTGPARALFIGSTGNVNVACSRGGAAILFKNLPSGSVLPVTAYRVLATSTTATDIVALY